MTTFTALTTIEGKQEAEALGAALENLAHEPTGVGVLKLEDGSGLWEVGAYFEGRPSEAELALLAAAFGAKAFAISELPDVDWVAHVRRELTPVEAGRFFVYGSHDADKLPEGKIPLLIEASMAFGTGHHGTTLGCLRAFDRLLENGFEAGKVADIGCGTAVLAMAAARVFDGVVIASDIDQVAVDVAIANTRANNLEDRVTCVEATGFDHVALRSVAPFDLIFANILKPPLIALAPDMKKASRPGTRLILSGILKEQADQVTEVYRKIGFNLEQKDEIGEWSTLTLFAI